MTRPTAAQLRAGYPVGSLVDVSDVDAGDTLTLVLGVCPDALGEGDEVFTLELEYGPGVQARFTLTVSDDDAGGGSDPGLDGLVFDPDGIGINGQDPQLLDEADAEQILNITVPYTVPGGHRGGAALNLRLYPSGTAHAGLGVLGAQRTCVRPNGTHDVLVSESSWTGSGGPTGHTTGPNPHPPDGAAAPREAVASFFFGVLCADQLSEPTESFTVEVWFTLAGQRSAAAAVIARIRDDDRDGGSLAAPGRPGVTAGDGEFTFSYNAAVMANDVEGWYYQLSTAYGPFGPALPITGAAGTSSGDHTVVNVVNGTGYRVRVQYRVGTTRSRWSPASESVTPGENQQTLEVPRDVGAVAGDGYATVSWEWTGADRQIKEFQIRYAARGGGWGTGPMRAFLRPGVLSSDLSSTVFRTASRSGPSGIFRGFTAIRRSPPAGSPQRAARLSLRGVSLSKLVTVASM